MVVIYRSFLFFWVVLLLGCTFSSEKEGFRCQALLDEAELYIESRQFDLSEEKIAQALERIEDVLSRNPSNIDISLLKTRAYFLLFMTRNTLILEQARIRPRSLVRLPEMYEYRDYAETIIPAKLILQELINTRDKELSYEQRGFIHASLAAIFRLNLATAKEANEQYNLAVAAYRTWLNQLKSPKTKIGSKEINIHRIQKEILDLCMAQAEVNLLQEHWVETLDLLERTKGGKDLKYFSVQFELIEEEIAAITNKCIEEKIKFDQSRGGKLSTAIQKARSSQLSYKDQLICSSPYEFELRHKRQNLQNVQNNLMYRIICYYHLNQQENLDKSRHILRTYYPELDQRLAALLMSEK